METKSLCAKIPLELHAKVCQEKEVSGLTLNEYITKLLTDFYNTEKGGKEMVEKTRTLAFQVPEELFNELKAYLKRNNISQKDFVIGLIKKILAEDGTELDPSEAVTEPIAEDGTIEPVAETSTNEAVSEPVAEAESSTDEATTD